MGRAEAILKDYEIIKETPVYRSIVVSIGQKIRGNAETTLLSYNVAEDDWPEAKRVLMLHYADKRNLRTLEYQMGQMTNKCSFFPDNTYTETGGHCLCLQYADPEQR